MQCSVYQAVMFKVIAAATADETRISHVSLSRPLHNDNRTSTILRTFKLVTVKMSVHKSLNTILQ